MNAQFTCIALALILGIGSPAGAQTSDAMLEQQAPNSSFEEVRFTQPCYGWVQMPLPENYIEVWMGISVDGILRAETREAGFGYVPIYAATEIVVDRSDVRVECTMWSNWTSNYDQLTYPRRMPDGLVNRTEDETFTFLGVGNYERFRIYQVTDNYAKNYTYSGAPVDESYDIPSATNGCNIAISTASATLNNQGRFSDRYTTFGQPIPACAVNPSCTTQSVQTIRVDGRDFSHSVEWRCDGVTVNR